MTETGAIITGCRDKELWPNSLHHTRLVPTATPALTRRAIRVLPATWQLRLGLCRSCLGKNACKGLRLNVVIAFRVRS